MAPPLPPPGVPARAGLAPVPIAVLWLNRLLSTVHETPMLLSAAAVRALVAVPGAPPNVLLTT